MPVVSSTYVVGAPQADGRVWVTETHTFDTGAVQTITYLVTPGFDIQSAITRHAASFDAQELYVPQQITSPQARRAVEAAGLKAQVEAVVAAAGPDVQALWYTSDTIQRSDPNINALASQVPLTSAQLDDLFRQGAKL